MPQVSSDPYYRSTGYLYVDISVRIAWQRAKLPFNRLFDNRVVYSGQVSAKNRATVLVTMRIFLAVLVSGLWLAPVLGFAASRLTSSRPTWVTTLASSTKRDDTSSSTESEAERLLRRARELRAQAEHDANQVHQALHAKKTQKEGMLDDLIKDLFFSNREDSLADILRNKRLSLERLESVVERLDQREAHAQGLDHCQFEIVDGKVECRRVASEDKAELDRLSGLIEKLVGAVAILDKEYLAQGKAHGADREHWGGGYAAQELEKHIRQIRRERSEQFQKRMEEFREAQRLKDDPDHKFKGYEDFGNLGG